MSAEPLKTYAIRVDGFPEVLYSARSPGKARYRAYLDFSEPWPCSFRDFLAKSRCIRVPDPSGAHRRVLVCGKLATLVISPHNGKLFMWDGSDVVMSAHESEIQPMVQP